MEEGVSKRFLGRIGIQGGGVSRQGQPLPLLGRNGKGVVDTIADGTKTIPFLLIPWLFTTKNKAVFVCMLNGLLIA